MRSRITNIIATLTPAQTKAFLAMPLDSDFIPAQYARNRPTLMVLMNLRLIRPVLNDTHGTQARSIVTPLGRGVRNILETEA